MMEACMMESSSPGLQLFSFIFKKGISSIIELSLSCYLCPAGRTTRILPIVSSIRFIVRFSSFYPHEDEDVTTGAVS